MTNRGFSVRLARAGELPEAELLTLYRTAGWLGEEEDSSFLSVVAEKSALLAAAFEDEGGRLIGMARALSDGVSDAYLQDVAVLPEYRRRGVGGALVRLLVRELRKSGVDWIGLIGEPGSIDFYRELGFETLSGFVPMRYRGKE